MASQTHVIRYGSYAARALHAEFPPIDLHADTLMWTRWIRYKMCILNKARLPKSAWFGHVDIPRLQSAGAGGQFFGLVTLPVFMRRPYHAVHCQIDRLVTLCRENPQKIVLALSAEDAENAKHEGKLAAFLGVEGAHALLGDLHNLETLACRGVRYLGMSHFSANKACFPEKGLGKRHGEGVSKFGILLIRLCESLGVIVDLAHMNRKGFLETCMLATRPVLVSHTGVSGAFPHWRNIDDEQVRAVARTGGVIGIMFAPKFLGGGLDAVVRHMQHVIDLVGDEHVALGSDYDGMVVPAPRLADVSMLPNLTDAMLATGWNRERIGRVLRGNVLRILRDVPPQVRL